MVKEPLKKKKKKEPLKQEAGICLVTIYSHLVQRTLDVGGKCVRLRGLQVLRNCGPKYASLSPWSYFLKGHSLQVPGTALAKVSW